MIWCCSSMLLIANTSKCSSMLTAKRKASVAFHVPRTDTTTRRHEETSLQRIRWILFAPKLSCWKLAKRFFASRNVSIFNTCLKQKVILSCNCENQVENISFKGKGIDHWGFCGDMLQFWVNRLISCFHSLRASLRTEYWPLRLQP